MTKTVYRTAIYARLSKDDGDGAESNSISSQKALCGEYISKHGDLELVESFVDDGYSGVSFDRPAFEKMMQAVKNRNIDAIVCNIILPYLIQSHLWVQSSKVLTTKGFGDFVVFGSKASQHKMTGCQ